MTFIGLDNYARLFQDRNFGTAFRNTLIYGIGSTVFQNVFGLLLALFVNSRFRGNNVVRTIVYMPIMISGLIMGYIMYYFLSFHNGVLNDIIAIFGRAPVDWLASPKFGVGAITFINSWQYVGTSMVIYLAGLQNIPSMYYEAAALDGVNTWGRFQHITLPLLTPAISSAVILNLIGGLKLYDGIISLTNGGPGFTTHSLMTYVSQQYFAAEKAGYSAAIGIFTFVLIALISGVCNHFIGKREVEL